MATRITKKHIGRPVDFYGSNEAAGAVINGVVEAVRNGMTTVRYWAVRDAAGNLLADDTEGFTTYLKVTDRRIVAVY